MIWFLLGVAMSGNNHSDMQMENQGVFIECVSGDKIELVAANSIISFDQDGLETLINTIKHNGECKIKKPISWVKENLMNNQSAKEKK